MNNPENQQKFAEVAIIGLPNAGKSTLLNSLVGQKVSIISPRAHTTRRQITGIGIYGDTQVLFVDTPGVFLRPTAEHKRIIALAWDALREVRMVIVAIDIAQPLTEIIEIINRIPEHLALFVTLNKIDKVPPQRRLEIAAQLMEQFPQIKEIFMTVATKGSGIENITRKIQEYAQFQPWPYTEDQLSTLPQMLLAEEITREQLFWQLYQELPYKLKVVTEKWEQQDNGAAKIYQLIYIDKPSHKAIVVGKAGSRIKSIGIKARQEMEKLLGHKVHLYLHVKQIKGIDLDAETQD